MTLKILYIYALPRDQHSIPVEGEYTTIFDAIARSKFRSEIDIRDWPGMSVQDFQRVIQTFQPNVLHFSGHASNVGDLAFQGPEEESQKVPKDPFTYAFKLLGESIKLVVLSACYSKDQAEGIVKHVDRVIGTGGDIEGGEAIAFSKMFYESIGNGDSIEKAFDVAKNQLSFIAASQGKNPPDLTLLKNSTREAAPLILIRVEDRFPSQYVPKIFPQILKFYKEKPLRFDGSDIHYVVPDAVLLGNSTWSRTDEDILTSGNTREKKGPIHKIVEQYLRNYKQQCTLIGGSFGSGKTTVATKLASEFADQYLKQNGGYIPLLVSLKEDLDNVSVSDTTKIDLKEVLNDIDLMGKKTGNVNKVLFILDSFEDYDHEGKNLIDDLLKIINDKERHYISFKVIITSTLGQKPLKREVVTRLLTLNNAEGEYIRLLPFNPEQVDKLFREYKCKSPKSKDKPEVYLTYKELLDDLGWDELEVTRPLFTWMIARMYLGDEKAGFDTTGWTRNERRSFLVLNILHGFIPNNKAPYKRAFQDASSLRQIKTALRLTSALMMLHKKDRRTDTEEEEGNEDTFSNVEEGHEKVSKITYDSLKEELAVLSGEEVGEEGDIQNVEEFIKDCLLGPYLYKDKAGSVNFIHSIFHEYLLAEYFIECILKGKPYRLNIGIPSSATTQFIDGLVSLLLVGKKTYNDKIKAILFEDDHNVLNSLGYSGEQEKFGGELIRRVEDSFKRMEASFSDGVKNDPYLKKLYPLYLHYYELSIPQWILLYFLTKLNSSGYPVKEENMAGIKRSLSGFLLNSSTVVIPSYLKKLINLDLSFTDLSYSNLSYFTLDHSKLLGANLFFSNISNARFHGAQLSLANLHRTYAINSKLPKATLRGTNLRLANLTRCRFCSDDSEKGEVARGADLSEADLTGAFCYRAEFRKAILKGAILTGANLSEADLSEANLSEADLSEADLTGAKLQNANLEGAVMTKTNLTGVHPPSSFANRSGKNGENQFLPDRKIRVKGKWPDVTTDEGEEVPYHLDQGENLTDIWRANDGALYYINHQREDNVVWWFGVSNANRFGNIFNGEFDVKHGIICGEWADVPRGTELNNGKLNLRIRMDSNSNKILLQKTYQTSGYAGSIWKRKKDLERDFDHAIDKKELKNIYEERTITKAFDRSTLTGRWRSKDTSFNYYIHEVQDGVVWWLCINKKECSASVFKGIIIIDKGHKEICGTSIPLPSESSSSPDNLKPRKMELIVTSSSAGARRLEIKDKEKNSTEVMCEELLYTEI